MAAEQQVGVPQISAIEAWLQTLLWLWGCLQVALTLAVTGESIR